MEAHVILKQGAVRRVGTGKSVNITKDPWLPSMDPYVQTNNEAIKDKMVDVLMVTDRREWDVDLINDIFIERDAQLILSLPLNNAKSDSWFWKWNRLGEYMVKSAYDAIREAKQGANVDDGIP